MAELKKITDLTAGTPTDTDVIPYVDLVAGATKKALKSELKGDKGDTGSTGATGATGAAGADGDDAYVYIAYASDASGTGFTTTFDADLDYIAVKTTTTEIATPQASDFTGLWKNYKGAKGDTGDTGTVTSETSSATPTINTDNTDIHRITALAVDITSMTTNLSGTPTHGQKLIIEITGTAARAITWGASFEASTTALPTTTVTTAMLSVGFVYNSATSKWRCLASA